MDSATPGKLGTRTVCQVAIVVRDIDRARHNWAGFLGLPVPPIITTAPGNEVGMTYAGRPSDARAKLAFLGMENLVIELIEPLGEGSSWQAVLDERGEGFHHIAFKVVDTAGITQRLAPEGISVLHQGGNPSSGQYTYLDAREKLGVILELLEGYR